MNANILIEITKPFFLKKMIIGPPIVPEIHTIDLEKKLLPEIFFLNISSLFFCI